MKKIIGILALFIAISTQAQEIKWMTMNEAIAAQKKNPKPIFMDVYTNWCGPCKMLDKNTFHNVDVASYINENFYAVKFNAEGNEEVTINGKTLKNPNYDPNKSGRNGTHELTYALGVRAYPTMMFFDEKTNIILPVTGYYQPQQLEPLLKFVGTGAYKNIKTQEEFDNYQKNFKGTFK